MICRLITEKDDGRPLRDYLKGELGLSRHCLSLLKKREDGILLNGVRVTVRAVLRAGDSLVLHTEDRAETVNPHLTPVDLPFAVLYEDEALCLCRKPSGMPTHPSCLHREDTLANALAFRYRDTPFVFRAITRLDRETDGIVLVARHAPAAAALSRAMAAGEIRKEYLALVEGVPPEEGYADRPIRRVKDTVILRECAPYGEGEAAFTRFVRLTTNGSYSLLRVFPETGRTHQIRVHLSAAGFPLVGDTLYGAAAGVFPRVALHADRLVFPHPVTEEKMDFSCPLPPDMADFIESMKG